MVFATLRVGDKFRSPLVRSDAGAEVPLWVKYCRGYAKDERGFCVAMLEQEGVVLAKKA